MLSCSWHGRLVLFQFPTLGFYLHAGARCRKCGQTAHRAGFLPSVQGCVTRATSAQRTRMVKHEMERTSHEHPLRRVWDWRACDHQLVICKHGWGRWGCASIVSISPLALAWLECSPRSLRRVTLRLPVHLVISMFGGLGRHLAPAVRGRRTLHGELGWCCVWRDESVARAPFYRSSQATARKCIDWIVRNSPCCRLCDAVRRRGCSDGDNYLSHPTCHAQARTGNRARGFILSALAAGPGWNELGTPFSSRREDFIRVGSMRADRQEW